MSCSAKPTISKPITTCEKVTVSFPCEDHYPREDGEQSCVGCAINKDYSALLSAGLKFLRQLLDDFVGWLAAFTGGMSEPAGA